MSRPEAEYIKVYKMGFAPLTPFKCELAAYEKNGWSTEKPKESQPDETDITVESKFKSNRNTKGNK